MAYLYLSSYLCQFIVNKSYLFQYAALVGTRITRGLVLIKSPLSFNAASDRIWLFPFHRAKCLQITKSLWNRHTIKPYLYFPLEIPTSIADLRLSIQVMFPPVTISNPLTRFTHSICIRILIMHQLICFVIPGQYHTRDLKLEYFKSFRSPHQWPECRFSVATWPTFERNNQFSPGENKVKRFFLFLKHCTEYVSLI